MMKTRNHIMIICSILIMVFSGAIGYVVGEDHTWAKADLTIVQNYNNCVEGVRFTLGDESVSMHKYYHDSKVHQAWMRCNHKDCYWQSSEGRWGIVPHGPRFPWFRQPVEQGGE